MHWLRCVRLCALLHCIRCPAALLDHSAPRICILKVLRCLGFFRCWSPNSWAVHKFKLTFLDPSANRRCILKVFRCLGFFAGDRLILELFKKTTSNIRLFTYFHLGSIFKPTVQLSFKDPEHDLSVKTSRELTQILMTVCYQIQIGH